MNGPTRGKSLILVTGAGRSGTSTIAGTLHHLGYHVPQPVLKSNASNPRGFFESTWPLWFHRRIMDAAGIEQIDGRPEAAALMWDSVTPEVREELRGWLAGVLGGHDQVVVKDPRSAWVPHLWDDTGRGLDATVGYLTMLRHPAEIVGSRSTYYTGPRDKMGNWAFSVMNLCGWVNINLVVERHTRDLPRVWVRYPDLLEDWRAALGRVAAALGLDFGDQLDGSTHHRVDDFVDAGLRRHEPSWEGLDMPDELREVAEEVWHAGCALACGTATHTEVTEAFDHARSRYDLLFRSSVAIARDDTIAKIKVAERRARRKLRRKLAQQATSTHQPVRTEESSGHLVTGSARRLLRLLSGRRR